MAKIKTTDGTRDMLVRDCVGKHGVLLADVQSRVGRIPKGTTIKIVGAWRSGFNIETLPCDSCGVQLFVSQVHRDKVIVGVRDV